MFMFFFSLFFFLVIIIDPITLSRWSIHISRCTAICCVQCSRRASITGFSRNRLCTIVLALHDFETTGYRISIAAAYPLCLGYTWGWCAFFAFGSSRARDTEQNNARRRQVVGKLSQSLYYPGGQVAIFSFYFISVRVGLFRPLSSPACYLLSIADQFWTRVI